MCLTLIILTGFPTILKPQGGGPLMCTDLEVILFTLSCHWDYLNHPLFHFALRPTKLFVDFGLIYT